MISFWQTDERLVGNVRKYGCAMLDGLYLLPDDIDPHGVNTWYAALLVRKYIDSQCTIKSWALFLGALRSEQTVVKFPLQFSRISTDRNYVCGTDEREILKWWIEGVHEDHFTIGTGDGNVLWDSMNRPDIMDLPSTKFLQKVIVKVG